MDREYANKAQAAEKLADVQPTMMLNTAAGRQSTKSMLMEHAERLRREAHQLEALAYQVDAISGEADQMLYRLLSGEVYRR